MKTLEQAKLTGWFPGVQQSEGTATRVAQFQAGWLRRFLLALSLASGIVPALTGASWAAPVIKEFGGLTSYPQGITLGPDGNLWFTEGTDKIGRINPLGVYRARPLVSEFGGLTPNSYPKRPSKNNYAELHRDHDITVGLQNRMGRAQVPVAQGVA